MILPIPLDTLHRARTGDAEAFEQLLRTHERQVLRLAVRLTGNLADAQDVAQDVFLKLHRELSRFRDVRELAPWLNRVTVNACFDIGRRVRRHRTQPIGTDSFDWRSKEATPHQELERVEQKELLQAGLLTLSERERAAVVLRELEGLSTAEVAEALGSAESTVRVQIASARVKLRQFVERKRGSGK